MYTWLSSFFENISGFFHVLSYTTTRCGASLFFSFFFTALLMPKYISFSHRWQKEGQPIRYKYLPEHNIKYGTPTMGGCLIILSILLSNLIFANLQNYYILILIFTLCSFGIIGFVDDYCKIKKTGTAGIKASTRIILQIFFSTIAVLTINHLIGSYSYSNNLTIPFFRKVIIEIGIFYTIFRVLVIIGTANAINLTDGLDGLCIVPIIFTSFVFIIFGYVIGNISMSKYLLFDYQSGAYEICVFLSSLVGSGLGFLWFNAKPAKIFMGDTGSLALGGVIGVSAVLLKCEILLAIAGGLFVIETLSVILQVCYFKLTKGKRLFKMTPIHHHFEKCGWSETQVIVRFWIISFFFCLIALSSLKIR